MIVAMCGWTSLFCSYELLYYTVIGYIMQFDYLKPIYNILAKLSIKEWI